MICIFLIFIYAIEHFNDDKSDMKVVKKRNKIYFCVIKIDPENMLMQ